MIISNTNINKEDEPRVNSEIRTSEVLLIDDQGNKLGVIPTPEALRLAEERDLDLVEVAPLAHPPVCRILDYGKYRFQQQKRDKDARKKQKNQTVKEMKMRPKIDQHDYDFKVRAIKNFLEDGHRVKVSIFFRGREMAFLDRGREVLNRVRADIESLGKVETEPRMEGAYMRMMVSPQANQPAPVPASKPEKPEKPKAPKDPGAAKVIDADSQDGDEEDK
ncbi:MAG: translation initiation factor IF-3 [Synergistaceae bacterium]|nr:translation initiation factor IF-3 [Synergistaceae bacterium]